MRTLFLALEDFRGRDRGSRIRDWYNVQALATLGEVTVLTFSPGPTIEARWNLEGVEFLIDEPVAPGTATARAVLRGSMYHVERYNFGGHREASAIRARTFELVVASQIYPMASLEQLIGPDSTRPPVLWDTHNFDADVWDERAETGSFSRRTFGRVMRARSAALVGRSIDVADGIVACTQSDRDSWRAISGEIPVALAPNAVDVDVWAPCRETEGERETFVLFGSLNQDSTRSGALWFLDKVWPGYVAEHPDARLIVTGRQPGRELIARVRSASRAELVASPLDLVSVVARAGTVVVPQTWGTGSKLKMVEALASGRRVVASPPAMVGLPGDLEGFVDIVDSVEGWHTAMEESSPHPRGVEEADRLVDRLSDTLSWQVSQRLFIEAALAVTSR